MRTCNEYITAGINSYLQTALIPALTHQFGVLEGTISRFISQQESIQSTLVGIPVEEVGVGAPREIDVVLEIGSNGPNKIYIWKKEEG